MGNSAAASMSPVKLDSGKPRVRSIGSGVLPANISSIVAEYLSDYCSEYIKVAFLGVQPINLCLWHSNHPTSHDVVLSLGSVSLEHRWAPTKFKVDKSFLIKDPKACLHFLEQENTNYCPVVIEVLTVDLVMDGYFCNYALDDLQNTTMAIQRHLKSVKHVVISVSHHAYLIFSLNEVIDTDTGAPPSVDKSKAVFDIIDDLKTCWKKNYLNEKEVLAFYFKSNVPRKSEKYLMKFLCGSDALYSKRIFKEEALRIPSSKLMWVLKVDQADFEAEEAVYSRLCNAFHWNGERYNNSQHMEWEDFDDDAFSFRDNPFVERIVMNSGRNRQIIQLPRPSTPLTDISPRSPLIEITLESDSYTIHLTELNNGYFPHLRHLCVTGGKITGHLDSHRVPILKTLILEPGVKNKESRSKKRYSLFRDRVHSLLRCGRPWQVVATQTNGGWSFASYSDPVANPHDEVKENSTFPGSSLHALPRIKKLLLVALFQENFDEWHTQLKGCPSLEAANNDHKDRLLVWEPQCVEKITVFCATIKKKKPRFEFTEVILERPRILTSLECHNVSVDVDGDVLPKLQTLEVNGGLVKVSGTFPSLKKLKLNDTNLHSPWLLEAPLLQSLDCYQLKDGQNLSMSPKWLSKLSSLEIVLFKDDPQSCPVILDDKGDLGFSGHSRVVFGKNMALFRFFDQYRLYNVSNLELTVNVLELPACWDREAWQCETLTIHLYAPKSEDLKAQETPIEVQLPFCRRVKTLTVTETNCRVLFDKPMINLTVLSVGSPASLSRYPKCPALKRIRFTEILSDIEKQPWLNPATYELLCAQPSEIIFAADYELYTMAPDAAPNEKQQEDEEKKDVLP